VKVIIQVSFCFETEIENRVLRVLSIDLQKRPFTCDKRTRNGAATIFTLFIYVTVGRHNWVRDGRAARSPLSSSLPARLATCAGE
jgi:hypothetical protein